MTSAEQFANFLTITQRDNELRLAGLAEFEAHVAQVNDFEKVRLLAFRDESFLLDALLEEHTRELMTFEDPFELAHYLMADTQERMRELREFLLKDPGSDEFDNDLIPFNFEDEDDDSPELA